MSNERVNEAFDTPLILKIVRASPEGISYVSLVRLLEEKYGAKHPRFGLLSSLRELTKSGEVWVRQTSDDKPILYYSCHRSVTKHPNSIAWGVEQILGEPAPFLPSEERNER